MRAAGALIAVIAVCVTGCYTVNSKDFGGQSNIQLAAGLKSDIWLGPTNSGYGVPLVYWYENSGGPFNLRLQIWDERKEYQSIEIREIEVAYPDGRIDKRQVAWARQLKPFTQRNSSSDGIVETEMMQLSDEIAAVVDEHVDVRITLRGELTKASGEKVSFDTHESFTAKSSVSRMTYAEYWSGI